MLRRTVYFRHKLVVVESPNKVQKITSYLNGTVSDWSFGHAALKGVSKEANEKVTVVPTVGHFMELKTLHFKPKALPSPVTTSPEPVSDPAATKSEGNKKSKKKTPASKAKKAASEEKSSLVDYNIFAAPSTLPRDITFEWSQVADRNTMSILVSTIQSLGPQLSEIILASDPDREGELISHHVHTELKKALPNLKAKFSRAYIHSITQDGITQAMAQRRLGFIDDGLASAAQTRHGMDRFFGYLGSSVVRHLNPKFRSIGRVQTPALIAIADREEKIEQYNKEHTAVFTLQATCSFVGANNRSVSRCVALNEVRAGSEAAAVAALPPLAVELQNIPKEVEAHTKKAKEVYVAALKLDKIVSVKPKPATTSTIVSAPPLPFSMATLIAKANKSLKMSSEGVSKCLQDLFQAGLVTYPRTDSHRIDPSVVPSIQQEVERRFGKDTVRKAEVVADSPPPPSKTGKKKVKAGLVEGTAEDAHEAIRPTDITRCGAELGLADSQQRTMYDLIRSTTLASFMTPMTHERATCELRIVTGSGAELSAKLESKRLVSPGYRAALSASQTEGSAQQDGDGDGDEVHVGDDDFAALLDLPNRIANGSSAVRVTDCVVSKSKPNPPPPHTEGSLIEHLKKNGVGRPSTYPSILKTLFARQYIVLNDKGRLETTLTGRELVALTKRSFPSLVDINFTAGFEAKLDSISRLGSESKDAMDYVLSEFLIRFLQMVVDATHRHRRLILERSTLHKLQATNKPTTAEDIKREVDALLMKPLNVSDLLAATCRAKEFTELQRSLDSFVRREMPPLL